MKKDHKLIWALAINQLLHDFLNCRVLIHDFFVCPTIPASPPMLEWKLCLYPTFPAMSEQKTEARTSYRGLTVERQLSTLKCVICLTRVHCFNFSKITITTYTMSRVFSCQLCRKQPSWVTRPSKRNREKARWVEWHCQVERLKTFIRNQQFPAAFLGLFWFTDSANLIFLPLKR